MVKNHVSGGRLKQEARARRRELKPYRPWLPHGPRIFFYFGGEDSLQVVREGSMVARTPMFCLKNTLPTGGC